MAKLAKQTKAGPNGEPKATPKVATKAQGGRKSTSGSNSVPSIPSDASGSNIILSAIGPNPIPEDEVELTFPGHTIEGECHDRISHARTSHVLCRTFSLALRIPRIAPMSHRIYRLGHT